MTYIHRYFYKARFTAILIILLLGFYQNAFGTKDALCWNEKKLSWSDFQGEADPRFKRPGMRAAITDAEIRFRKLNSEFKIESIFNKKTSWMVGEKTESGLAHEQRHFDLAEAFARKAREAVRNLKTADDIAIATKIESILAEHDAWQTEYDQDVQMRGLDRVEQQNIWDKKIANLLRKYQSFASDKPCQLPPPGKNLTKDDRQLLIARMIRLIDEKFVDIPAGKKVVAGIKQNLSAGKYNNLTEDRALRKALTKDLYEFSKDLHLSVRPIDRNSGAIGQASGNSGRRIQRGGSQRVRMGERPGGQTTGGGATNSGPRMRRVSGSNANGFAIRRPIDGHFVGKVLQGNIGYVKVNGALYPAEGTSVGKDMVDALAKVRNSDAVIFDLRDVPGGVPDTISLLSSYLYDDKPKLLNTYYHRTRGARELLTEPSKVPFHFGEKLPVYVLINSKTASGGEAFTYLNQQHGRVTVIGETSRGAGRLSAAYPISQTLRLMVPENRSEHPVSKTGFEKVGVKPNINAKSNDSLYVAHVAALNNLLEGESPANKKGRKNWHTALVNIKKEQTESLNQKKKKNRKLKAFSGVYGIRTILVKDGKLVYQKKGQIDLDLKEIARDTFKLVVPSNVRTNGALPNIRFNRNDRGEITSFSLIKTDGSVQDTFQKQ